MFRYYPLIFCILLSNSLLSQPRTVGVVKYTADHKDGYCLFSPVGTKKTFLMDKCGRVVKEWSSDYPPGLSVSLMPNGDLLRTGALINSKFGAGVGGVIEKFGWSGQLKWRYTVSDSLLVFHHDVKVMPNGNILAILWETHSIADAVSNGRDPDNTKYTIWSERIQELMPVDDDSAVVVWEWRAWDHMVQDFDSTKANYGDVQAHRELFDINFTNNNPLNMGQDWFHFNSIDYNADLDQIMLSAHSLDEIYVIDHSTTTAQAASHSGGLQSKGGDVLFRWGNSVSYKTGDSTNWRIFHGHHATWIPKGMDHAGEIMFFNNGLNRNGAKYSTIDRIIPPVNSFGAYSHVPGKPYSPLKALEVYKAPNPSTFYSAIMGGVYPIDNDRILVTLSTSGTIYEILGDSIVWKYVNPITGAGATKQGQNPGMNYVFRCEFYPPDYAAFDGKDMTPGLEIEKDPYIKKLCDVPLPPLHAIKKINTQKVVNGVADSLGIVCRITGTIQSSNWSETGVHYLIADNTGSIAFIDANISRQFQPGDSLVLLGKVAQFAGWCAFTEVDSIWSVGANKLLRSSLQGARPAEIYESSLITLKRVRIANDLAWPTNPLSAGKISRLAIRHTNGDLDSVYIYSATNLDGTASPKGYVDITGFVGQFDNSQPFTSGYALVPRSVSDIQNSQLPEVNFDKRSDTAVTGNANYGVKINNISMEENFTCSMVRIGGTAVLGSDYTFANQTIQVTKTTQFISEVVGIDPDPDFTGLRWIDFAIRPLSGPGTVGKDSLFTLYIKGKSTNSLGPNAGTRRSVVFPNPNSGVVHFQPSANMKNWMLKDALGRVVVGGELSSNSIQLPESVQSGYYLLVLKNVHGEIENHQLVVQK